MIDVHNHLLPALDDGAENLDETLRMCRMAAEDGIDVVVATPHAYDGKFVTDPDTIRTAVAELNDRLAEEGIDLMVLPGMEVRVSAELPHRLLNGEILPLNDRTYVLVEFHPAHIPVGFENLVHQLVQSGYRLILAHPEQNIGIQARPEYLYKLLNLFDPFTILCQITAASIMEGNGSDSAKTAKILLENNLAHLMASDAHNALSRPPVLSPAVNIASSIIGEERAAWMVTDFPRAVIEGEPLSAQWEPQNPRRWWRLW
ncbi:MAG: CpsB/CapC family capsule biosynthesis tyrosine phosphatase [Desulfomonilaceae bacterium]|nr:CpsB/CapC family capsule biosynthesis tyrosine phosphatase [Desulfomonilaceae bacterium]